MKSRIVASLGWTLGFGGILLIAGVGTASAAMTIVPELDPGSAAGGIALMVCAALLIVERYHVGR
jgi:hypothetical protein